MNRRLRQRQLHVLSDVHASFRRAAIVLQHGRAPDRSAASQNNEGLVSKLTMKRCSYSESSVRLCRNDTGIPNPKKRPFPSMPFSSSCRSCPQAPRLIWTCVGESHQVKGFYIHDEQSSVIGQLRIDPYLLLVKRTVLLLTPDCLPERSFSRCFNSAL